MSDLTDQQFEDIDSEVSKSQPPLPQLINSLVDLDGAYARLLKKVNTKPVLISRDVREFRMGELVYVRRIEILAKDVDKVVKGLSIVAVKPGGKEVEVSPASSVRDNSDGTKTRYVQYVLKDFVEKFRVRSTLPFRRLTINQVSVVGYSISQLDVLSKKLEKAVDTYYLIDKYVADKKKTVQSAKEELESLEQKITDLEETQSSLEASVEGAGDNLSSLEGEVKRVTDDLQKLNANLKVAQDSLASNKNSEAQLKESIASANREIVQKRDELQSLVNDRNLISDEYRDYVSEGKLQSKQYIAMLIIPMIVIAFCSWQLYSGAHRILSLEDVTFSHIASAALQRLPFAAAIALIIAVSWKIASLLINRIMTIHGQRLALAKLLVIAKDTVASAASGLDVEDEDRMKARMHLKLEMLKSHLKSELGQDFSYHPLSQVAQSATEPVQPLVQPLNKGDGG